MAWRMAKSLEKLREQINASSPGRSKASDGGIGDPAHASRGKASDHNPWIKDSKGVGVVTAMDITNDPGDGVDGKILSRALTTDSRVKYVIFNSQIWKARTGKWEPYRGSNKHTQHVHVSVNASAVSFDDVSEWPWPVEVATPFATAAANLGSPITDANAVAGETVRITAGPTVETVTAEDAKKGVTTGEATESPSGATEPANKPDAGPPPPAQAVEVKASRPSLKSTAVAIFTFLMAPFSYIGIDANQVGEFAKGNVTLAIKVALVLALVIIAVWVWDRAMTRANLRTLKIVDKASDKDAYSVRLVGGKDPAAPEAAQ